MKRVMFVTTTSTYANKGRDVLKRNRIESEIKKVQGGTAAGCLYGIILSAENTARAEKILNDNGVRVISIRDVTG